MFLSLVLYGFRFQRAMVFGMVHMMFMIVKKIWSLEASELQPLDQHHGI